MYQLGSHAIMSKSRGPFVLRSSCLSSRQLMMASEHVEFWMIRFGLEWIRRILQSTATRVTQWASWEHASILWWMQLQILLSGCRVEGLCSSLDSLINTINTSCSEQYGLHDLLVARHKTIQKGARHAKKSCRACQVCPGFLRNGYLWPWIRILELAHGFFIRHFGFRWSPLSSTSERDWTKEFAGNRSSLLECARCVSSSWHSADDRTEKLQTPQTRASYLDPFWNSPWNCRAGLDHITNDGRNFNRRETLPKAIKPVIFHPCM